MIVIVAKFPVRPESADAWPSITADFTAATRAEPGCLWFDWSRSVEDPNEYVITEAFEDTDAGVAHVQSVHFKQAQAVLPAHLQRTPKIIHVNDAAITGWGELGEFTVAG